VLIGNGDGTFQVAVSYPAGLGVRDVAMADFNADGKLDIVTANGNASNISILLGNGDGSFESPVTYVTGSSPRSVAIADYNGDGILDLAVSVYASSTVSVLLGNGDGTFAAGPVIPTGPQPTSVRSADLNNDGKPDLVVTIGGHPPAIDLQNYVTIFLSTPLSVSSTSLKFNTRKVDTTSTPKSITLTNIGTATLTITGFSLGGADPGDFQESSTCGSTLAAGASCAVTVSFTPLITGLRTATLLLTDSGLGSPQMVPLSGSGK
jgi:hypothetical protein